MANDYTALQALVTGDMIRSDLTTVAANAILESIRKYEGHRFFFNEATLSVTLSATNTYALSLFAAAGSVADVIEIDAFEVVVNPSRIYPLTPVSFGEMIELDNGISGTQSYPQVYTLWQQAVRVYPVPNGTYTGLMSAHVKFTELSAGADSNAWTTDAKELIRCAAQKLIYGRYLKDQQNALTMQQLEMEALHALDRRTDALVPSRMTGCL